MLAGWGMLGAADAEGTMSEVEALRVQLDAMLAQNCNIREITLYRYKKVLIPNRAIAVFTR